MLSELKPLTETLNIQNKKRLYRLMTCNTYPLQLKIFYEYSKVYFQILIFTTTS